MIRRWLAALLAPGSTTYWYHGQPISRAEYEHLRRLA